MKNRYIPYGYSIQDGQLGVCDIEAKAVIEIFRLYCTGNSYKAIAEILNGSEYPPHSVTGWNKHHVKRILENIKYTGGKGYPVILVQEQFDAARSVHDEKYIHNVVNTALSDILWKRLRCAECGSRLLRNGSPASAKRIVQLRCENSERGHSIDVPLTELHSITLALMNRLMADVRKYPCGRYEQTPEALRLANDINRSVAKLDDHGDTVRLILAGISARYDGIKEPPRLPPRIQYGDENRLFEMDWDLFKGAVSHISLSHAGAGLTTLSGTDIFMESEDKAECNRL